MRICCSSAPPSPLGDELERFWWVGYPMAEDIGGVLTRGRPCPQISEGAMLPAFGPLSVETLAAGSSD